MTTGTKRPKAVIISDIHYNINTLAIADKALRMAVDKANDLNVPLIIAGDLHDTKANLRGECVKAITQTIDLCKTLPIILVGNHCRINERVKEHSLEFLRPYAHIVDDYEYDSALDLYFISYESDPSALRKRLSDIPTRGATIIMHQGLNGSESGEYIQDRSAINKEDLAGLNIISGHYHKRQTLELPDDGTFQYVGNPFTLNFSESNDPEKGFLVLYYDNSTEFIPTNLRRHKIVDMSVENLGYIAISDTDILWVKINGTKSQLSKFNKDKIAKKLNITIPFKLDLIATDTVTLVNKNGLQGMTSEAIYDKLIGDRNNDYARAERLKFIWREIFGGNK